MLGFDGDGGPATKALLNAPVAGTGTVYVADLFNARIRAIRYRDPNN